MNFTIECPHCKNNYQVTHQDLANPGSLKCCLCGNSPPPNILTAYQNIGKTITDLQGCCDCSEDKSRLPQD